MTSYVPSLGNRTHPVTSGRFTNRACYNGPVSFPKLIRESYKDAADEKHFPKPLNRKILVLAVTRRTWRVHGSECRQKHAPSERTLFVSPPTDRIFHPIPDDDWFLRFEPLEPA